jgi:hypothetical protein
VTRKVVGVLCVFFVRCFTLKNSFAIDGNPEELVQLIDIDAIKSCNILELRKPIKIEIEKRLF